jgi:hypothetical protein
MSLYYNNLSVIEESYLFCFLMKHENAPSFLDSVDTKQFVMGYSNLTGDTFRSLT